VSAGQPLIVVAGHICLDIIPTFDRGGDVKSLLVPGTLVEVGPAVLSTGGAVSNAGLALHRLGVRTRLMGKIGDDLFGDAVLGVVRRHAPALAEGMLITSGEPTSYSVVISPPGVDRVFWHCPGANNTFSAADVPYDELAGAAIFHFGYPPLMRRMYADGGIELATMMQRVKALGVVTSLDMSRPDPASAAGQADWRTILRRVLPHVDLFLPSLEETIFMLDRARFERSSVRADGRAAYDGAVLSAVSDELLALGAGVVGLKLGDQGFYVRTSADRRRLVALQELRRRFPSAQPAAAESAEPAGKPTKNRLAAGLDRWLGRELLVPCFEVDVVGTTGCGDCTIAGFLAALGHGLPLEQAMTAAVAVGACNVEQADATSGVPTWTVVQERIRDGWRRRPLDLRWPGWHRAADQTLARGPHDRQ